MIRKVGRLINASTRRISTASTVPPTKPLIEPTITPRAVERIMDRNPTRREALPP